MPVLTKVETFDKKKSDGQRKHVAAEYDALLFMFHAHDCVSVGLDEDDNRITVKNRLEAAAKRRGMWIKWYRGSKTGLRFKLMPKGQQKDEEYEQLDTSADD